MKKAKSFFIILIFLPCLQIRAQSPQLGIDTIDKLAKNATDIQYFSVQITERSRDYQNCLSSLTTREKLISVINRVE